MIAQLFLIYSKVWLIDPPLFDLWLNSFIKLFFNILLGIFCENMSEFIGGLSTFLNVQIVLITELYGVIHATEKA